MVKAKGLGRGLDALLGHDIAQDSDQADATNRLLALGQMTPGRYQPRTHMDPANLEALSDSIRAQGLLQPILVRPIGAGKFEIVAGERRWRAAQMAGLESVPVQIRNIPDESALAVALIENIQREDLNAIEEAAGLERLIQEFRMTHEAVAEAVGRSRSAVTNLLRLLQLDANVRQLLASGDLEMGHGRALLALAGEQQNHLAQQAVLHGWSVRETERQVRHQLQVQDNLTRPVRRTRGPSQDVIRLQQELSDNLGAEVAIKTGNQGAGTIAIHYHDLDQLDGILLRLRRA